MNITDYKKIEYYLYNYSNIDKLIDEIKDGKFTRLVIKKEEMTISMTLSFPKVISVDTVVFLRRRLSDFFVSDNMYTKLNIEFQYN